MDLQLKFREMISDIKVVKEKYFVQLVFKNHDEKLEIMMPIDSKYRESSERKLITKFENIVKELNREK